jgi:phosphate transport system protein
MGSPHTDREYEGELRQLRDQVLLMGEEVSQMISLAMRALVERDSELARQVIDSDERVDRLELQNDDLCLRILARRQPVASDLRFIVSAFKLVNDLERIGDLATNICDRVLELNEEPPLRPYVDLVQMADLVQEMLGDALDAFVGGDVARAQKVLDRDDVVDAYFAQTFRELLTYMMENPRNISRALRLQAVGKHLERIADHVTNLAEMVVFLTEGHDIRHPGSRGVPRRS